MIETVGNPVEWFVALSLLRQTAAVAIVVAVSAWLISVMSAGSAADGTQNYLRTLSGIMMSTAAVAVVILSELTAVFAEAPGFVSAILTGALGYLSLEGWLDLGPQLFVLIVLVIIVVAIAIREA